MKSQGTQSGWQLVAIAAGFAVACGGTDDQAQDTSAPILRDTVSTDDSEVINLLLDSSVEDVLEALDTSDAVEPPVPGSLGAACAGPEDCDSSVCLLGVDGGVCSQTCTERCPNRWACRQNLDSLPEVAFVCMPPGPNLCRPCREHADCRVSYDRAAHACVAHGDVGAFCGSACEGDRDCPGGAICATVLGVDGVETRQCQRSGGAECACSARAIADGARTRCVVGNVFGRCAGERVCGEAGLTACDAAEAAAEVCNGADDNCDGRVDEGIGVQACAGEGDAAGCVGEARCVGGVMSCDAPEAAPEVCNGRDDDCDGVIDPEGAEGCVAYFLDADGDGFGVGVSRCLCAPEGAWHATESEDCDDQVARVFPGATERCNGVDDNCDGEVDEGAALGCRTFYRDGDRDGFGVSEVAECLCAPEEPFDSVLPGDCADDDGARSPAAVEVCGNAVDDNCDGRVDEENADGCILFWQDEDGDGVGVGAPRCLCAPVDSWQARRSGDCDDTDAARLPGSVEVCDGKDNDCDGVVDPDGAQGCLVRFADQDGDGFGARDGERCLCAVEEPYSAEQGGDCNDVDSGINPSIIESCNGIDDNCDGRVDEDGSTGCTVYFRDGDGDGFGGADGSQCLCGPRGAFSATAAGDCDDANAQRHPGREEICNGVDDNCDGVTDEAGARGCHGFWLDVDGDGFGLDGTEQCLCAAAGTHRAVRGGDCQDAVAAINPDGVEVCDSIDNNCDGWVDDGVCGMPTVGWPTFMTSARRTGQTYDFVGPVASTSKLMWVNTVASGVTMGGSPVIDPEGNIYALFGATLVKVKAGDGAELWRKTLPKAAFERASPTVREGGTVLVPMGNGLALYGKDGAALWAVAFLGEASEVIVSAPAIDQSGTIFVASNKRVRALTARGVELWSVAIDGSLTKSSDLAFGLDGKIYVAGAEKIYSIGRDGTVRSTWCPLLAGVCRSDERPGAGVSVTENGRIAVPMGKKLYILQDSVGGLAVVASQDFASGGGTLQSTPGVFSNAMVSDNPSEKFVVTVTHANGVRAVTGTLGAIYAAALAKRDAAHGGVAIGQSGVVFAGSEPASGTSRLSARAALAAGNSGAELWGYNLPTGRMSSTPALGVVQGKPYVVFGSSDGKLYRVGEP